MVLFALAWAGHILYFVCFYRKGQRKNNTALEDFDYEQLQETTQGKSFSRGGRRKNKVRRYEEAYGGNVVLCDPAMDLVTTKSRWSSMAKVRVGRKTGSGRCDGVKAVAPSAASLASAHSCPQVAEESSKA